LLLNVLLFADLEVNSQKDYGQQNADHTDGHVRDTKEGILATDPTLSGEYHLLTATKVLHWII